MTSFFCFVNKRAIYRLGIISLAHVSVHVTDFPVVNVPVDELSSARIWYHKLCEGGIVRKRKYKLLSSDQSIVPYLYSQTYQNRNKSRMPEHILASVIYCLNEHIRGHFNKVTTITKWRRQKQVRMFSANFSILTCCCQELLSCKVDLYDFVVCVCC